MPNPVNRGSNKPAQRKGSQVTSRVARKWIGLADAGEWGRAWLPAQAPGRSRTMGGCEQLFSASVASPLSKTAWLFSRTITPLIGRPKVGLGIYIYSCHAGELFGFVPVARDEQAFSC